MDRAEKILAWYKDHVGEGLLSLVCTSSRISSTPWRAVNSRALARYPSGATRTPASPCTGSTIKAAGFRASALSNSSSSPKGTVENSGKRGPNGALNLSRPAAERLPIVLPW